MTAAAFSATTRALFRAAADRPAATGTLPTLLRLHWPELVAAILALADDPAADAHLALSERLSALGTRPHHYLALHGAFEGVLARTGGDAAQRAAWEGLIDAALAAMLTAAHGLHCSATTRIAA